MKKSAYSFFCLLLLFSACNDAQIVPLPDEGTVVASIDYTSGGYQNIANQTWTETYSYDDQGRLKSIEDTRSLGRLKVFQYQGDQLVGSTTTRLSDNQLIFRDSINYDQFGRISQVFDFSINHGEDLPMSAIETLTYDSQGQVIEITTNNLRSDDYNPRRVFHWEDGNVVKEDRYWNGVDLSVEYFTKYDDKTFLNAPGVYSYQSIYTPTKNNPVEVEFRDYTGVIDAVCNPCKTNFTYLNDRPVAITWEWNQAAVITYKEIESGSEF